MIKSARFLSLIALFLFSQTTQAAYRDPVRARSGMVASANRLASQVGVDILRRGGNAVDASVATAFALAVTYPSAGNLGGGGFMLIRTRDGKATAIDYRETAPRAATRNIFLDAQGEPIQGEGSSTVGYRAAGVPGTVAGMELAVKRYGSGKFSWAQLIEPARKLALNGFPVSYRLSRSLQEKRDLLNRYADSRRIFLRDGKYFREGEVLRQPELAATLARLQKNGAREFYAGQTASLIAQDMQRHNGLITLADLGEYSAKERAPLRGTYRGHEIITMPPPSSGGAVLLNMLNILEGYELREMGWSSAEKYHVMAEAMRRAFADRAEYFGDPDFVSVPVEKLISKEYSTVRRADINLNRASTSAAIRAGTLLPRESEETTHFSVVDKDGNAVSNTYTLNGSFGAGATARGTGVLLNNEMDDFAAKPGTPNLYGLVQNERNAVAPKKRPLSSMTPTFVLKNGKLHMVAGSPGGPTIINTVLQIILNVVDHEMNIQQAVDAPRVHHQWLPDEIVHEPLGLSLDTRHALEALGHKLSTPRNMGDAQAIMLEPASGVLLGASDSRQEGAAIGY